MSDIDIDQLTNTQLDRLWERLTYRVEQRKAEKEAADRERRNPRPLRPNIGNGGIMFGSELARRNWDSQCIDALGRQTVPYAVAPMSYVDTVAGKRLGPGQEVRPNEHLSALNGDRLVQLRQLIDGGFLLEKVTTP
ncbi:MAG TPA: hypothetical protein VFK05_35105 [Polyangiaceae bacterium]|nr:hypothetical protein [Polyangiaceae bacterium]